MKNILIIIFLFYNSIILAQTKISVYLQEARIDSIHSYVYNLSSSKMEGREVGKIGDKIAADYISSIFRRIGLDSIGFNGYFQKFRMNKLSSDNSNLIPQNRFDTIINRDIITQNVIGFFKGGKNTNETIVISGHYDHLGKINDSTFYAGADDNASGVASMIEIARMFQIAAKNGIIPEKNILFIAFDAEEKGMLGSSYFINNVPDTIGSIILNINLDMLGRNRRNDSKYNKIVFMIGWGKNKGYYKRKIKYQNRSNKNLFIKKYPLPFSSIALKSFSDHYMFINMGIPAIHFQTGMHNDNHTISDSPDKVNYERLTEITKLLCKSIWEIANNKKNLHPQDLNNRQYSDKL